MCNFLKNCHAVFQKGIYHFTFPPAVHEGSNCSTFSSTLAIVCLYSYRHSNECEVVFHCDFDLRFLVA